ncbi:MAG: 4Fe-4S binding protein [Coriobacteriia bacterium]
MIRHDSADGGGRVAEAHIDTARCDRSPGCPARRLCPRGAIVPLPGGRYPGGNGYTIEMARCAGCGVCVSACPTGAVSATI